MNDSIHMKCLEQTNPQRQETEYCLPGAAGNEKYQVTLDKKKNMVYLGDEDTKQL